MGHNRRREKWEIAEAIKEAKERIQGISLGAACAANVVFLEWLVTTAHVAVDTVLRG